MRSRGTAKQCEHRCIEQSGELAVRVVDDDDCGRAIRADLRVRELGRGGSDGRGGGDEADEGEGGSDGGETHGDDDEEGSVRLERLGV
jgi:hypothetical protein